jgi:hypothetical protein
MNTRHHPQRELCPALSAAERDARPGHHEDAQRQERQPVGTGLASWLTPVNQAPVEPACRWSGRSRHPPTNPSAWCRLTGFAHGVTVNFPQRRLRW